ncbi:hypothetical protein DXG01_000023 [Tephrocybe rancida]|nr:hypothetical protein DXG01_000023 [Tephrocybe rancida]
MPNSPRRPREEFLSKRIPGAQFLDLDEVASPHELGLKHMMPQERVFADACGMTIYDSQGVFSSPRALFMFRTFGHQRSSILDGGLPAWIEKGYPVESGAVLAVTAAEYSTPTLQVEALRSRYLDFFNERYFTEESPLDYDQIVANSDAVNAAFEQADLVLDARSLGRYTGRDPEPRPGLSSGHIPNSLSLPFNLFLRQNSRSDGTTYTTFLPPQDLRGALEKAVGLERAQKIIDSTIPVTTTCGSGMTAGILWLGLKLLGAARVSLYDEASLQEYSRYSPFDPALTIIQSWTGYAMRPTSKIEKSL